MHSRIIVGLDGSASAQYAMHWAVREAARRHATVLVVTAWPIGLGHPPASISREAAIAGRRRIEGMQRAAIVRALDGLADPPAVGREIVLAEPVVALCHAASAADLVVVGSDEFDGLRASSLAARLAVKLSERRHGLPTPTVVIPTRPATPARSELPVGQAA